MLEGDKIKVAQGENPCYLLLNQANRHGLIAGASGTGKTVTMKVLAEGFAQAGVPVFMADVKGDVTGMAQPGDDTEKVRERAAALGAAGWEPRGCDVRLWDMLGGDGVPVRITISDMGPDLLARLLGLTDVQRGVLAIAFRMADDVLRQGVQGISDLISDFALINVSMPARWKRFTAACRHSRLAPFNARCSPWKMRAATSSSANRRWISLIGS